MARLKHLFIALLTAGLGGYYLHGRAQTEQSQIRQAAEERLKGAPAAVATVLTTANQQLLAQLKGLQLGGLAEAMDDEGKPTAEALEAARTAVEKASAADAERPVLVVVAAQGVGGRYRLSQSNRFDKDLSAFPALTEPGPLPRAGIGILDGELSRFAVMQFEDTKVQNAKGLVALAYPLDDTLARRIQTATGGLEVIVLNKDKVIGATLAPTERQALQAAAAGTKGDFDFGPGAQTFAVANVPLPLFAPPVRYRASVLPPVPGLPADLKIVVATRTLEQYASLAEDQKAIVAMLGIIIIASLLLMLLSGNPARGLSRVVSAAEKLAQGDRDARAPTDKMTTLVRRAAVAVNNLAGQVAAVPSPAGPSFAEQLGIKSSRSSLSQPPAAPAPLPPEPEPGFAPEPGASDVDNFLQSAGRDSATSVLPPPQPSPATVPSPRNTGPMNVIPAPVSTSFGSPFSAPASSSTSTPFTPKPKPAAVVVSPSPHTAPMYTPPAPTYQPPAPAFQPPAPSYEAPADDEFGHDQTVIAQTPEALLRATQRSTSFPASPNSSPGVAAPSGAVALPPPSTSGEEAHFQQVYKEFVATREKCGEPADGLTFDKFAQKLRKNQEQLVQKYQCRTVRFQVYVKEGKAALKATPVR